MAIPRVTENSVNQQGYTGARVQAADFGEGRAISQGAQDLGRGINQAALAIDKIDEMYDTAAVKQADADDLKEIMQIKAEVLSAKGFEAQSALESGRQRIEELRRRRLSSMKDGRQQRMYTDVFDARRLQLEETFTNHSIREIGEANRSAAIARGDASMSAAVDSYGTPEFDTHLGTALSEISAINPGAGPDVLNLKKAQVTSKVYHDAISSMLVDPENVQEAQLELDENADKILPEHEMELRKRLQPLLDEDEEVALAGWALSASPVPGEPAAEGAVPAAPSAGSNYGGYGGLPVERGGDALSRPISPADPTRGKGRVTETAQGHRARGSGNALDIAAPAGTPLYPPMSGKVIKNWYSEDGGWSILVEHPNGYVSGYAHMRGKSPLAEGSEVESGTIVGSVGSTGKSTGPHVHYTVRQSRAGPKVDPNAVDWGQTVDPKKVDWKEGPLALAQPREDAMQTALSRLNERASREGWSQRKYDRVAQRVMQIGNRQDQLFREEQNKVYDGIMGLFAERGETITSVAQVPGYEKLTGGQQLSVKNMIASNLKGADEGAVAGQSLRYLDLLTMVYENPEEFARIDRRQMLGYMGEMKPGEFKSIYAKQLELQNDPSGRQAGRMSEASTMAGAFLPTIKGPQRLQFMDRYVQEIEQRQRALKRRLSDPEKMDVARALTVEAVRYDRTNPDDERKIGKGYLFEYRGPQRERAEINFMQVWSTMPNGTRARIAEQLGIPIGNVNRDQIRQIVDSFLEAGR
jgi:murein DD-endopeptidase MepM/ murein hydrolase activator NlpD